MITRLRAVTMTGNRHARHWNGTAIAQRQRRLRGVRRCGYSAP